MRGRLCCNWTAKLLRQHEINERLQSPVAGEQIELHNRDFGGFRAHGDHDLCPEENVSFDCCSRTEKCDCTSKLHVPIRNPLLTPPPLPPRSGLGGAKTSVRYHIHLSDVIKMSRIFFQAVRIALETVFSNPAWA